MKFIRAWFRQVGDWIKRVTGLPEPTVERVMLGDLLPTVRRTYFDSIPELPFAVERPVNLTTAWWCAETSMLAYQSPAEIEGLAADAMAAGWKVSVFGTGEPIQAVLLKSGNGAILAFRGTRVSGFERLDVLFTRPWVDYEDLKTDAAFAPVPHPAEGKVHGGILAGFQQFWERHGTKVIGAVDSVPLFLTGHSLGAALATMVAASEHLPSKVALYTFGSPRVGDAAFRSLIAAQGLAVHRFVHGNDLVTTLAPEGWLGFTHVGSARHIKRDGSAIDEMETNLASVLIDGFPSLQESVRNAIHNLKDLRLLTPTKLYVPRDALADHAPKFYVERIKALARGARDQDGM